MLARPRSQADLLDLDNLLRLSRLAFLLLLVELVFAKVEQAADRRHGIGRDLNQVQTAVEGQPERLLDREDAELVALFVDDPHLADPNLLINASGFGCYGSDTNTPQINWGRTGGRDKTRVVTLRLNARNSDETQL